MNSLLDAWTKAVKKGLKHWTSAFFFVISWLDQPASIPSSLGHLSETSSTRASTQGVGSGERLE